MRILLISQWWQPEPAFKGLPFALGLKNRGYEVEVLTGFPNYPGGNLYPGYSVKPWQREMMAGISVLRTALYPSHNSSGFKRIMNYLSFSFSSCLLAPFFLKKPDVIYVFNLVTLGPTALLLKALYRCPVVYDIQDIWPDSVFASGMVHGTWLFRLLNGWCNFLYRHINKVVVLSPGYKILLAERNVSPQKIKVIYNWDPGENDQAVSICSPVHLNPDRFNIIYAGNMGRAQSLETVLLAANLVSKEGANVHFTFIGDGVDAEQLKKMAVDMKLENATFLPRMPQAQMQRLLHDSDALLVHLKDDPVFRRTIPSKTQTYLAAGKPILMGVRGDAADLIWKSKAGLIFEPENATSLRDKIKILTGMKKEELDKMGQNGFVFYKKYLSFQTALDQFERLFGSLLEGSLN